MPSPRKATQCNYGSVTGRQFLGPWHALALACACLSEHCNMERNILLVSMTVEHAVPLDSPQTEPSTTYM